VDHNDHVWLIRGGVEDAGSAWADLGAGSGAFTLALADILGAGAELYAVDRDARALRANRSALSARFPGTQATYLEADFTRSLRLPALDGVVMANSLHFQRDQLAVLRNVRPFLAPGGRIVVVEYNINRSNGAVPHPLPFERWQSLASEAGFEHTRLLERRPSRFLNEMYSAVSW
jgi:ubiquinone/menaquinone biosynthesis C-methylase UbiE